MSKIRLLDELTINQIAAGEVVESPISVLKELVENSVDAGARHLKIEAKGGGFQYLSVIDDGEGMNEEDLKVCLLRHATSKLKKIEDLGEIQTMGFRGEALASIAAVSELRITTRAKNSDLGAKLISRPGSLPEIMPASRTSGTSIEVLDLFENLPARKAFQKSAPASASELSRWVGLLAMAYPQVSFNYTYNKKEQFSIKGSQEINRTSLEALCERVMGEAFLEGSSYIHVDYHGKKLHGLLGNPLDHRPTRLGQTFIINGRLVSCPQLSRAVQEGYSTRLPPGRFPQFLLYVNLPTNLVDVNVHPQKKELRFKEIRELSGFVAHQVNLALAKSVPSGFLAEEQSPLINNTSFSNENLKTPLDKSYFPWENSKSTLENTPLLEVHSRAFHQVSTKEPSFDLQLVPLAVWKRWSLWSRELLQEKLGLFNGSLKFELAWMSSPRALARIRYEEALGYKNSLSAQALLIPFVLELAPLEVEKIVSCQDQLQVCGFEVARLDSSSLAIYTIPSGISETSLKDFFLELSHEGSLCAEKIAHGVAKQIEQHGSLVANSPSSLILALMKCKEKFYSPLGRAIFRPLEESDFEVKGRFAKGQE